MKILATTLIAFVAVSHVGILILEMFYWDHPIGRGVFGMTAEESALMATLAANQGLYNGFLAAGLFWGLLSQKRDVIFFFLICVMSAGVFGALTAKFSILFTQALPAAIAFILMLLIRPKS